MSKKKEKTEKKAESKGKKAAPKRSWGITKWGVGCFFLAAICGVANKQHVQYLFESDKHFSHLSTMERDMAFRTEMGLYYSYYQSVVDAKSWWEGFDGLVRDTVTEHPKTINVLKRFNLYPELIVGSAKRIFDQTTKAMKMRTKDCWQINRGEGKKPVQSCEGIGDDHYFYIAPVWWLTGLLMSGIFLYGATVSESLWGGLIAVTCYFFNHGEATRVMWTPPLRESWSFPFLILQLFLVTRLLNASSPSRSSLPLLVFMTSSFMITWQFAQFALLTQTASVMGCYLLRFIGSNKLKLIVEAQAISLAINYVLQFGNEMLLTSFFASSLITVFFLLLIENVFECLPSIFLRIPVWLTIWVSGTLSVKYLIAALLQVTDDSHIFDIFRAKFTDYKNFHTQLYTCAKEFDFLEWETVEKLSMTLLLPAVVTVFVALGVKVIISEYNWWKNPENVDSEVVLEGPNRSKPHAAVVYTCIQAVAFTSLAIMIMRMKLFMTPQLCIVASLLASPKLFSFISRERQITLFVVIMAVAAVTGTKNLAKQWNTVGEYENPMQEELLEFITDSGKIPKDAVFAGSMPTMATVKLVTKRKIVNHPHYEDTELRDRTYRLYSMFSRRPLPMVHKTLVDMDLDYFILEDSWCVRKSRDGCALPQVYDIEDVEYRSNKPVCEILRSKTAPYFKEIFKNQHYTILKLNKKVDYSKLK